MHDQPDYSNIKVTKVFYTFHPDFVVDDDGKYTILDTGKYGVEWDIRYSIGNISEHYITFCDTEEEAKQIQRKIMMKHEETSPWICLPKEDEVFSSGTLVKTTVINKMF